MTHLNWRPVTCPACGKSFGPGKGLYGTARHPCDDDARYLAAFFKVGVDLATCAAALGRTDAQAEALLQWGMARSARAR